MIHKSLSLLLAGMVAMALISGGAAVAGDYHTAATLHCSDCHIMHASKDGTLYNGGAGNDKLLQGASVNALCLTCHDNNAGVPDVVATGGTVTTPGDTLIQDYNSVDPYGNGAGSFQGDYATASSGVGHNLYATSALTAIQGTWTSDPTGMKCSDCHSVHSATNWRNLKTKPGGIATAITIAAGTQVFEDVAFTAPPASTGQVRDHYKASNVGFADTANIVSWCVGCHTNITSSATTKHPQSVAVSAISDAGAHWTGGTGVGFGTTVGDGTAGIPRVRFGQTGASYAAVTTAAATNQVFCLTCHKGHGSKYDSTLVWPHYEGGADQTSACGQCHNKGA